ncbi:MAG TPA: DUF4173 domain-containing protein [Blastocatellia bacterium]|jgi:hypothetical protein|nr:DUF4173 domain-containing protein [Blastocatellia bacterium]
MTDKTRLGISLMAAGFVGGALGDALLRATPWGLNLVVWIAALIASVTVVLILNRVEPGAGRKWLVIPLLFFAAAVAWRDSTVLKALNLIGVVVTLSMILMRSQAVKLLAAGVTDYAFSVLASLFSALAGAGYSIGGDIQWKEIPRDGWAKHLVPVAKGLAISIPLLLIFGGLLASADAVFSGIILRLFDWDVESLVVHCLLTAIIAWAVAGFLRGVVTGKEMKAGAANRPAFLWLGVTETAIILGLLDVLFLKFVVVQFQYFFGGAARIQAVAGLTYAEYARSGFFELVGVAALVLPLLLATHWLLRKEKARDEIVFRILAGAQIALLFVIMVSALQRMRLYQREYGLTELRVYTTVFMGWLAVVFVWFAMTVLRGRRERFAFGAVATGFLAIGALVAVNPDRLIARVNVDHAIAGRDFDAAYAASLSADAVPELIEALAKLNRSQRCALAAQILQNKPIAGSPGWRRWNWSCAEAARALAAGEQELRESTCR